MTVGLFGGTFNPFHFGHLNLSVELFEKCALSKILFMPAFSSPLKQEEQTISPEHRLCMVKLAVEGIPGFEVVDWEILRKTPSYTIDAIRFLKKSYPDLLLLLGEDSLQTFPLWKEADEIARLVPIRVGCRTACSLPPAFAKSIERVETNLFDISATGVRDRLKKGLYCGHLIPAKVLDYIHKNQLYCISEK